MRTIIYPVNVKNFDDVKKICSRIKSDTRALGYIAPKSNILHFFAEKIDYRAAAFLKQELLSRGGDTVVTKHVIDGKTDFSDVLLMATPSQLKSLLEKLKAMDCWGLKDFRESLTEAFHNIKINEWVLTSPNNHNLILNDRTKLMAIINLTPDSFYEGSRVNEHEILSRAEKFLNEGAEILDLGAESTRPGFEPVTEDEELKRLIPALKILRKEFPDALISVDTYKSNVAKISAYEGADIINDISGFEFDENMPEIISSLKIPYVLSHIKDENLHYENIIGEINSYFDKKLKALDIAGVKRENIILDPGIGFGKNEDDNFKIIKNIESLKIFGLPVLVGHSRKRITGKTLSGTLAITAILNGRVNILRVHDVKENMQALLMARKISEADF